jgi:hypothetical protein
VCAAGWHPRVVRGQRVLSADFACYLSRVETGVRCCHGRRLLGFPLRLPAVISRRLRVRLALSTWIAARDYLATMRKAFTVNVAQPGGREDRDGT